MARQNGFIERVLDALETIGPMGTAEIAVYFKVSKSKAASAVTRLARKGPNTPRRAHITEWDTQYEGERKYPRALYAAGGDKPDAVRPKASHSRVKREYRQRRAMLLRGSSVFNLGRSLKEIRGETPCA